MCKKSARMESVRNEHEAEGGPRGSGHAKIANAIQEGEKEKRSATREAASRS